MHITRMAKVAVGGLLCTSSDPLNCRTHSQPAPCLSQAAVSPWAGRKDMLISKRPQGPPVVGAQAPPHPRGPEISAGIPALWERYLQPARLRAWETRAGWCALVMLPRAQEISFQKPGSMRPGASSSGCPGPTCSLCHVGSPDPALPAAVRPPQPWAPAAEGTLLLRELGPTQTGPHRRPGPGHPTANHIPPAPAGPMGGLPCFLDESQKCRAKCIGHPVRDL